MDDFQAIAQLQHGDIAGLETLVRRYQVRAIYSAYLITQDQALAEDIVQSAFIRAYERIAQFDAERPFGPWFLKSVINAAIKAAKRQSRQVPLEPSPGNSPSLQELLASALPSADLLLEQAELRQAIRLALDRLSPEQRAAIVQRYFLGMSEVEMSAATGHPRGTVKSRLSAARQRLRYLLGTMRL